MTLAWLVVTIALFSVSHAQQQEFGGKQAFDTDHIKEHLDGKVDVKANMTPEQLQFHYFRMYDLDRNGLLDGIELITAITHYHEQSERPGNSQNLPVPREEELEKLVDAILAENDFDHNGLVDYGEFLLAEKRRQRLQKDKTGT